jgi:hypothetical protein
MYSDKEKILSFYWNVGDERCSKKLINNNPSATIDLYQSGRSFIVNVYL